MNESKGGLSPKALSDAGPGEYIITLPGNIYALLGLERLPLNEAQRKLIELIMEAGARWLLRRIKVLDLIQFPNKLFILVRAPGPALADLLEAIPHIERIYYNFQVAIPDPQPAPPGEASILTHETAEYLGFSEVHKDPRFGLGRGLRVGVVDTGMGPPRPGPIWPPFLEDPGDPNSRYRVVAFRDFTRAGQPEGPAYDDNGHGTAVAEIIASARIEGPDGKAYVGAAPMADLVGAKVLDSLGRGYAWNIISGIRWMMDRGVDVMNLSLGSDQNTDGSDPLSAAVDEAWAKGIVVVVAAGNSGKSRSGICNGTVGAPACAREAIKATATSGCKAGEEKVMGWASRPPTADGRKGPEFHMMAAPGLSIEMWDPRMRGKSGTSFAAPFVAGYALVVIQRLKRDGVAYGPDEVRAEMERHCKPLGYKERQGAAAGWCIEGWGRIDPLAAWSAEGAPAPSPLAPVVTVRISIGGREIYSVRSEAKVGVEISAEPSSG